MEKTNPAADGTSATTPEYETVDVETLVVGAGAAGARAAIEMVESGVDPEDVLVIGKRSHGDAHTTWARGGVNGALGTHDEEDDWTIHAADTLKEGHFLNDPQKVETVTKQMPARLRELDDWGMEYSRTEDGEIDQRYFGAQSFRRTAFAGDHTGESMLQALIDRAQELGIPYRENVFISKLVTDDDQLLGAAGYDMDSGEFVLFDADITVLAAGGYTSLFHRHSSRDDENTGDGPALAYLAGAALQDMEFVQFHPTGMVGDRYGEDWDGRLVTEAVRGEGGRLYNADSSASDDSDAPGERFMERYSPDQMELDARDVVARAIAEEIEAGRGTDSGGVYLDISHRDRDFIQERLPRMYERFDDLGVDLATEPVEVAPTAHYGMGGVVVDESGETAVDGLYAIGETMVGVHGANRLGGNSLAETIAFGAVTGDAIAARLQEGEVSATNGTLHNRAARHFTNLSGLTGRDGEHDPEALLSDLRTVLWETAGIRRTAADIDRGLATLERIRKQASNVDLGPRTGRAFEFALDLGFGLVVAGSILRSARKRTESRGAHYRTDYPDQRSELQQNIQVTRDSVGAMHLETTPVGTPSDAVQEALDANYELDYHQLE